MESFNQLKRRTTDLLQNVHANLPARPSITSPLSPTRKTTMNGTWERIDVPPLPRSSHSLDVVSGSAYVFGGEINPREPVDNLMHVVKLPWSSAGADYYTIKPVAAKQPEPVVTESEPAADAVPESSEKKPETEEPRDTEKTEQSAEGKEFDEAKEAVEATKDKGLDNVELASPIEPAEPDESPVSSTSKGKEPARPERPVLGDVPAPRVGHATAVIGSRIFLFGGRGGPEMKPLEEAGRVWIFDTRTNDWTFLDPAPAVKGGSIVMYPGARSYHCATASDRPRDFAQPRAGPAETWSEWALGDTSKTGTPQAPIVGNVAEEAIDEESQGYGTLFIHAGCLANGDRATDLWAFNVHESTWTELPAAPGPARGGTAICISKSRLFRFGGYDGQGELGGQLDFLHLEIETFDDRAARGEVSMRARGGWQTISAAGPQASSPEVPVEPDQPWPQPRSVASLEALTIGGGREYLVLTFGERDPSSEGHAGAGKFFDDVWMFQVPPLGMTPASVTAAFLQAVGRPTGEGKWTKVDMAPYDDDESDEVPEPRGWLASAVMGDAEEDAIVLWGGLGEDNERLGDGWILRLGQ